MTGYEFTERGKVIIVVLVISLLIIPAAVIAFRVWSDSQTPDDPGDHISQPTPGNPGSDEQEPDVTESPPPEDNGQDPVEPPGEGNGEQGSFDPPVDPPDDTDDLDDPDDTGEEVPPVEPDTPEIGPIGINLNAGTMEFMFAPELQDALDDDTFVMFGDFITSPRNTRNSIILVEMPSLSTTENAAITSAITSAFSQYGIPRRDLSFETYQSDTAGNSFAIMLTFIETSSPK